MNTLAAKLIAGLVISILLVLAGLQAKRMWDEYQELKDFKSTVEAQAEAASSHLTALDQQISGRQTVEIKVLDNRATSERAIEELKRNDQDVANWSAQLIPVKLRELDAAEAERRMADHSGGGESPDATSASRRANPKPITSRNQR